MTDVLEQTPPEPLPAPAGAHQEAPEPAGPRLARPARDRVGSISLEGWITFGIVLGAVVFTLAQLHPDLLFSNTTPTGGDMGAHVWGPAYLRDHLLPHFRLSGWAPDWYAGFPMYQFYMVIPALAVVLRQLDPSLRARPQARVDRRRAHAADRGLGVRQAQRPQVPGAGAVRRAVRDLPVRRELHDLRRQHRLDDGRRVLVLDRAVARVRLLRSARARPAHRTAPRARRRAAGTVRAVPPDRRDLRGGGHRRAGSCLYVDRHRLQVAGHDAARRCPAHRVLGACRSSCAATT